MRRTILIMMVLSLFLAGCNSYDISSLAMPKDSACQLDCSDLSVHVTFNGTTPVPSGMNAQGCSIFCEPVGETK